MPVVTNMVTYAKAALTKAARAAGANEVVGYNTTTSAMISPSGGTISGGGGSSLTVQDEGSTLSTAVTTVNFVGAGVTATGTTTATVTIPGVPTYGTGVSTFLTTPTSANLAAALTDETGTGANVFATSPTLVTPVLGTPTSGTLTNCTGLPVSTGVSGLGTGVAAFLATPSSANLAAALTDETGTGANVFATSPTLVTPNIGAATGTSLTTAGNITISVSNSGSNVLSVANPNTGVSADSRISLSNATNTGAIVYRSTTHATDPNALIITAGVGPTVLFSGGIERLRLLATGEVLNTSTGGLGYGTGSGGAVTQITSRTTGVTLNKTNGAITLFSAAGSATWASFTVTNSTVAATDVIEVCAKSGTNLYLVSVTAVAAGSFQISFATTGGTATDAPVFNFAICKAVTA
jgi:hypothetical protein